MKQGSDSYLADQLRAAGLRVTRPRLAVSRCLLEAVDEHLTADRVLVRLRAGGCRCARASVYNVLKDLAGSGLVQRIAVHDGATYFDPVTRPHPHLYIPETGELLDLPPESMPDADSLGLSPELRVQHVSMVVHASRRAGAAE